MTTITWDAQGRRLVNGVPEGDAMTLPPLPEPAYPGAQRLGFKLERAFSSSEMRAYGEACALAERERCASWCRQVMEYHQAQPDCAPEDGEPTFRDGEACGAEDCIEAIASAGNWP